MIEQTRSQSPPFTLAMPVIEQTRAKYIDFKIVYPGRFVEYTFNRVDLECATKLTKGVGRE